MKPIFYAKRRMLNARIPGDKMVMDPVGIPYNYTRVSLPLPLPLSFISAFSGSLSHKEAALSITPDALIPFYEDFFSRHFAKTIAAQTLIPAVHKEELIATILGRDDWHLVWVSPVEDPDLLRISSNQDSVHFIHSNGENEWKLAPKQLETWCKENSEIVAQSVIYLPRPLAGNPWRAGEFKRLSEVAKKYGVYFLREEFGTTRADESLLHFYPEKSLVFYNPFYGTYGASWGLGCVILPQNASWNSVWKQATQQNIKPMVSGLELAAIRTYFKSQIEIDGILAVWEEVLEGLRKEIYELLSASKLRFNRSETGNSLFIDFDAYRPLFGRKGVYNASGMCKVIFQESKVKLVPGSDLGCPPGTLAAAMYLTNLDDLEWVNTIPEQGIETSILYKRCWNCIDGAQKLMRYLNSMV